MADQKNGTVKWFNSEKGFGFIQIDGTSEDVFVHHSEIENKSYGRANLDDGQEVSLTIGKNEKGSFAQNVTLR